MIPLMRVCPENQDTMTSLENKLIQHLQDLLLQKTQKRSSSKALRAPGVEKSWMITGMRGCLPGYILSALAKSIENATSENRDFPLAVVVTPNEARASALAAELEFFLGPSPFNEEGMKVPWGTVLPQNAEMAYGDLGPDTELELERLGALFRLSQKFMGPFLILSVASLGQKLMPRKSFEEMSDMIGPGQTLDRQILIEALDRAGYRQMPVVEDPGCYSVRGAIVDVYSPAMCGPCRVEFDGDQIVDLRRFHTETQRTFAQLSILYIHPVRQTIPTSTRSPRMKLVEAAEACGCPSSKVNFILDEIKERVDFFGSESMLPVFHDTLEPLETYLPAHVAFIIEDHPRITSELSSLWSRLEEAHQNKLNIHRISFPPGDFFLDPTVIETMLKKRCIGELYNFETPLGKNPDYAQQSPAYSDSAGSLEEPSVIKNSTFGVAVKNGIDDLPDEDDTEDLSDKGSKQKLLFRLETMGHVELEAEVRRAAAERGKEVLAPLAREIRNWRADGLRVAVAVANERNAAKLKSLLKGYGVGVDPRMDHDTILPNGVSVMVGRISGGVLWPDGSMCVVSEDELFGVKNRRSPKKQTPGQALTDLSQLKDGDYVVHEIHGVGRYGGLERQVMGGVPADYLVIHYSGKDKLYLPVHRFSLVRRHVGASPGQGLRLDKLGGQTWEKKKSKVSKDIQQLAEQLLKVQAQRNALVGHCFHSGGELMAAFEATFPFEETPDQAAAIETTLSDMMSPAPMDRLVCGDVGYGKTEVAMRAAVLAVLDGKQTALLAPTAVLVEQHYKSFKERLRSFPISVGVLSRFRGKKSQNRTLEAVAEGQVDIVVGTHRLLSTDVRFKDLGLIIIDEEQRFGVAQKEKLKNLRALVDVISLTATPIPRTMQMALSGIREMSIIATPPPDRRSVHTYVCPYSPSTVTRAIRLELDRGGQVFFVVPKIGGPKKQEAHKHNPKLLPEKRKGGTPEGKRNTIKEPRPPKNASKIPSIEWWMEQIKGWLPKARVTMAHGQMDNRTLENTMVEFVNGEHDILVATSIIESGLDIPRANTILIMHADRFGLAQLYQLRGRVGRSHTQAYCYFMVDTLSGLTEKAKQRLAALERLSRLGSSFNLATEDLEIRGAGDVLGKKQSGQVAAVGFDTYFRMLEDAVSALKGEPVEKTKDCDLTYDIPAYLPDEWVPEPGQRLHYYQALARCESPESVAELVVEMEDLFGGCAPEEVTALAELTISKIRAKQMGAESLEISGKLLLLTIGEDSPLEPAKVLKLIKSNANYTIRPPRQIVKKLRAAGHMDRIHEVKNSLKELECCASRSY